MKHLTRLQGLSQHKNKPCKAESLVIVLRALGFTEIMNRRASGTKCHSMSSLLPNLKSCKLGKAGGGIATGQGTVYPLKNHLDFKARGIKDFLAHLVMSIPKGDRRKWLLG